MMRVMATPVAARLGAALRDTYEAAGISQHELAVALGVDQTTISTWARGMARPQLDALGEIEKICEVPKGTILRRAGYVDEAVDVVSAVMADRYLDDKAKRALVSLYESLRNARVISAKDSKSAAKPSRAPAARASR